MIDLKSVTKYLLEGLAVAIAAFYIPQRKVDPKEIGMIALTAAAVFMVLDLFAPSVGVSARQGTGLGIGFNMVGGYEHDGEDKKHKTLKTLKTHPQKRHDTANSETESTETESTGSTASTESTDSATGAAVPVGAGDASAKHEPFVSQPAPLYD